MDLEFSGEEVLDYCKPTLDGIENDVESQCKLLVGLLMCLQFKLGSTDAYHTMLQTFKYANGIASQIQDMEDAQCLLK